MLGALGNIGKLLGLGPGPEPKKDAEPEVAKATDNEHSEAATALAKPEVKADSSRDAAAFIKNVSPKTEDKFSTFNVKKFFEKLQSLNIGTEAAEYLEYGIDLNTITNFELFQSTMREVQTKLPKAETKTENPEAQVEELQNLEKELEGLATLLNGMEAAAKQTEQSPEKTPEAKKEAKAEDKPTPAKAEATKNEAGSLDALLKQLAA